MSTQEQTNANRTNAQSSTGPKTEEGKAASSQNAVKHGLFAKNDVISGEDLAFYESHRQDIYDEYAPLTPTEFVLTQRIASLTWRLMRADRLQTTTINTLVNAQQRANPPKREIFNIDRMIGALREKDKNPESGLTDAAIIIAGLARFKYETVNNDPALDDALNDALNDTGSAHICQAEIQLGTVIYNDFHGSAVLDRLLGYEQRMQNLLFKTIRQIQQIQERRIKQDIARDKAGWARLRAEDEERKRQKEAEYQQRIQDAEHRQAEYQQRDDSHDPPPAQNEANSDLTSTSDTTYNRSHREEARTNDPNQTNLTNPEQPPRPKNQ